LLMAVLRLLAVPTGRWQAAGRSVQQTVQRTALAAVLMFTLGPALGSFVLWLLVLVPFLVLCITIIMITARHL
jgi:hypothetical protein